MQSRRVDVADLEAKRTEDRAKRRGTAVNEDLLAYTEFIQLQAIILDNWSKFEPALGKKKYIDAYFSRLSGFRNPAMHSRPLREFERDLVSGIVGELRNLIVLYRTTRGPDMKHYPRIEQVTDSLGNSPNSPVDHSPQLRLEVGDLITFECRGWDPEGRDLTWELTKHHGFGGEVLSEAHGSAAQLELTVTEDMVSEDFFVEITMTSAGPYHRHGTWDETCQFYYAVNRPRN